MSNTKTPTSTNPPASASASANTASTSTSTSTTSTTNSQTASPVVKPSSAWARGPPPAVAAAAAASSSSTAGQGSMGKDVPQVNGSSTPKGGKQSGGSDAGGSTNGNAGRKGLSFGVGGSEVRGVPIQGKAPPTSTPTSIPIAFGTTALPNAILSSSPAAPSMTGSHLEDSIKTFGTVDASASVGKGGVKNGGQAQGGSGRKVSGGGGNGGSTATGQGSTSSSTPASGATPAPASAATPAPVKKFDVNKLFQGGGGTGGPGPASTTSSPSVAHSTPPGGGSGIQLPSGPNGVPVRPPPQSNSSNSGLPGNGMTSPIRQSQSQSQAGAGAGSGQSHPYAEAHALQAQNPSRGGGLGGLPQAYGYDAQGRPMAYPQQHQQGGQHAGQGQGQGQYGMNPYNPQQGPGGTFRPQHQQPQPNGQNQNQNGMKSPQMGHVQPHHSPYNPQAAQFRPPGQQQGQQRGGQQGGGPMQSPRLGGQQGQGGAFVVRPQQGQQYGGMSPYAQQQGYYPFFSPQQDNPYGVNPQQWTGQPNPYGQQMPISPRPGPASVGGPVSPAPTHAGVSIASTMGASTPSGASRPPSMGAAGHSNSGFSATSSQQSSVPTTPSMTPARTSSFAASTFTPSHLQNPSLHASASTFVPRQKSAAIKITREDGSQVDLASAAKAVTPASTPVKAPASASASPAPAPSKPLFTKPVFAPVVIRMETEEQKAARLSEAAKEKKIKDEEDKEAKERKEREVARKAREEKEKADKLESEQKAKDDAEAKTKADAESKAKAEEERVAKEKADAEAAAAKQKEEEEASAASKKAEEDAAASAKKAEDEALAVKKLDEEADAFKQKMADESEARKKADEELAAKAEADAKKAALPPSSDKPSAAPSPKGSPALGVAGLPPRPVTPAPAPLERKNTGPVGESTPSAPSTPNPQSATASAQDIKIARPIVDLSSVSYPNDMQAPDPSLNQDSTTGKYRYDRNFLLQFMRICMERPVDMQVPEDIGMFASPDGGSEFGRTQSNRGGSRSGGSRNASGLGMGMGGPMGNFGSKTAAGGVGGGFGMGNFSSGTRGTSSEDRLAASRSAAGSSLASARGSAGMVRTPSQGGPGGAVMPPSNLRDGSGLRERENTRIRSQRGTQRGQRDQKQGSMSSIFSPGGLEPGVAPLEVSANRWTPAVQNRRPGAIDENSPEYVERKVKGLLNKLTEEKFESISGQILEWANKSTGESDGMTLRLVIKLIFEKAKDEQFWSRMYARLCRKLLETVSNEVKDDQLTVNDPKLVGGFLFRKYLLNRCQEDFERGWKAKEDSSAAAKSKAVDDEAKKAEHAEAVAAGKQVEEFKFSDEYYAMAAAKRQGLGLVKFVGELFKLDMLSAKIIATCVQKLLVNVKDPDEEDVESLCQLLSTVGERLEKHSVQMKGMVGVYMKRLQELQASEHISSRMKFMVQDVIELQKHQWLARSNQRESGPMTIEEVHQQAARDAQEAARTAAQQQANVRNDPMSRGGSRRGEQRSGAPGANDQWQNVAARLPAKPADMSSFGKIQKSGGPSSGPSFAPQGNVFGRKKFGDAATPPISRVASSANISSNPFGALSDSTEADINAAAGTGEEAPQRKKLVLAPRSKDADSEEPTTPGAEDDAEAPAAAEAEETVAPGLSKKEVERKIKNDRAEFWGEKDIGGTRNPEDIVEYFEGLPEDGESRGLLAKALVEDVFRIAKQKDTAVVVDGFERATEKGVLTVDIAKQGLASTLESLDDAAIDIPQAYSFAAQLMLACGLSQEVIETLADTIEVLGEPIKTPKSKLLAEVAKLNKEAEA